MRQLSDTKTVLLTGATGYLGAFLLKSLIENTTATIVCLVRFTDPVSHNLVLLVGYGNYADE